MSTRTIDDHRAAPTASQWIAASFVGWTMGFVLSILFIVAVEAAGIRETQFPLALGMGMGVGFAQARLVSAYAGGRLPWFLTSAFGLAAPFIVADVSRGLTFALPYSLPLYVAAGGLIVGVLQWRLLRRTSSRAAWWILASAVGWTLAGSTVALNERVIPKVPGIVGALIYMVVILTGGIVLGAAGATVLGRISSTGRTDSSEG